MTRTTESQNSSSSIVFHPATTVDDPTLPAGVPEGRVEKTDPSTPQDKAAFIEHEEAVKHDTDQDGNIIGWHKEPAGDKE